MAFQERDREYLRSKRLSQNQQVTTWGGGHSNAHPTRNMTDQGIPSEQPMSPAPSGKSIMIGQMSNCGERVGMLSDNGEHALVSIVTREKMKTKIFILH